MKLKKFLSAQDRHAIEAAVRAAEAKTSGEIVPAVVGRSARYDWVGYRMALLGWVAASLAALWFYFFRPFTLEPWEVESLQVAGLVVGWGISRIPMAVRHLVSGRELATEVEHAAHACFLHHGVVNTRERNGVLLYVSLRERRVVILGDKGIHEKMGHEFWKAEADRVVRAIRDGRPAEGMVAAIQSMGEKLAVHFPRHEGDANQLPNRVLVSDT